MNNRILVMLTVLALWVMGPAPVLASEVLYDGVGFIQGTQAFTDSFTLATPGTLTVTLADVDWPAPLTLSSLVTDANGALGPETGPGTSTFEVAAGAVVAQWFGTASGTLGTGVFSMEIQFQPNAGTGSTVPLPTSIALFVSGLGLLLWQRRGGAQPQRADPPPSDDSRKVAAT